MNKITNFLTTVFNDNLRTNKTNKIFNAVLLILIVISTLEVILATEQSLQFLKPLFQIIYWSTSIIFVLELFARYFIIGKIEKRYNGFLGKLKFTFNFYTMIDIIAILPFILNLIGFEEYLYLKSFRILRFFKILRYLPSVDLLSRSIANKKNELLITLQVILVLAVLISGGLYYAEMNESETGFTSILQALLWSVSKYIQGIANYGNFDPVTNIGKLLATLNGVLGIAIFALPAGIIASGFMDEIQEDKKKNEVDETISKISKYYNKSKSKRKNYQQYIAYDRFLTFETIHAKLLLTENEIFEAVRSADSMRFKAMKSSPDVKFVDTKLIEIFDRNCSYGTRYLNEKSNLFLINGIGDSERGISHFARCIALNTNSNFFSREIPLFKNTDEDVKIGGNVSDFYVDFNNSLANTIDLPESFLDFVTDLKQIKKDDFVINLNSGASGGADFVVEFGLPKNTQGLVFENSTIHNTEKFTAFYNHFTELCKSVDFETVKKTQAHYEFSVDLHTKGLNSDKYLYKAIHKNCGADTATIYVNINILIDEPERYYAALYALTNALANYEL